MREVWLVDGYNLWHGLRGGPLRARTREELFEKLAGYAATAHLSMVVVLDGAGPDDEWKRFKTDALKVVQSGDVSADAYIERTLSRDKTTAAFVVVTSDRAITLMALGSGARVINVAEFCRMLGEQTKNTDEKLFRQNTKSRQFNRPFDEKLKDKDEH